MKADARLRRVAWTTLVVNAVLVAVTLATAGFQGQYTKNYGSDIGGIIFEIAVVVQLGVGALIAIKRPRHPVGWLLLLSSTTSLVGSAIVQNYVLYAIHVRHRAIPGGDLVGTLTQMSWILYVAPVAIFLPLVFPTGTLLSRRWRAVVWMAVIGMVLAYLGGTFGKDDTTNMIPGVHKVVLPPPIAGIPDVLLLGIILLPLGVFASIVSLALRYKRGPSEERHQIKWLLYAISIYGFGFGTSVLPAALGHPISILQDIALLGLALVPVSAAVAVLKYRLYDIDLVISRTLVYGSLAAFITAVYVGIVVGVGTLIGSGSKPNLGLSILATAIVAVAFQPVRERLQRIANRLVYGKRATPYEVLSRFSEHVAETYAGEEVLPHMARVLADGTGAERATVWLRSGNTLRAAAVHPLGGGPQADLRVSGQLVPEIPDVDHAVPVRHQGELLGALTVTKRHGESLSPIEEKLVDDLAHQAGLVLKNVGLTEQLLARLDELRSSRQRLVAAQDAERRRLERNLHDGAQQNLVAIKVKLGLAEMLAAKEPAQSRALLAELKSDADDALETLRDLARGIYPPLLADMGLVVALGAQARKAAVAVEVTSDGVRRYGQEVEAAVYFCCLEALQNVQKYSGVDSAALSLVGSESGITFEVSDAGRGFDATSVMRGAGLTNMTDRMEALGGTLQLTSSQSAGTRIVGWLPTPLAAAAA